MIATLRGLAVLAAIAAALLVLSLVGARTPPPIDRSLVPGFDEKRVDSLELFSGNWSISVKRVGDRWQLDNGAIADPAEIDAVFTALRAGRWHRRVDARQQRFARTGDHDEHGVRVGATTLRVGPALPATGQTWIIRGDDALLVDSWIATALSPGPLALRVRHPLACTSSITAAVADTKVRTTGTRMLEPHALWLDEHWLQTLADACAAIEIVALDGKRDGRRGLHIIADGELTEVGTCAGGRVFVDTSSGAGCVEASLLRALADVLRAPQPDLRPLPIDPIKLTLQDGSLLDVAAKRIGDVDADPDRVRELISALTARGTAKPRRAGKHTATITAVDRGGTEVTLELFDRAIARRGEPVPIDVASDAWQPVAIEVAPDAWKIITRPAAALRDPVRWREDAANLTSLTLDNVTYKRGIVLGEWTREPPGKLDPTLVDALVDTLATVRAPTAAAPAAIAHRLRITITPPAGAPITHAIELAAPTHEGCAARLDTAPVLLPLPLCTAVIALASSR